MAARRSPTGARARQRLRSGSSGQHENQVGGRAQMIRVTFKNKKVETYEDPEQRVQVFDIYGWEPGDEPITPSHNERIWLEAQHLQPGVIVNGFGLITHVEKDGVVETLPPAPKRVHTRRFRIVDSADSQVVELTATNA